jgi:glutathione S-transferase
MYPLWRAVMGLALDGDAAKVEQSRVSVDAGLDLIDQELAARGTPFLCGAEPGGMDVLVSALLSPVIWPPLYGGALPPLEQTPQTLQDFVAKTRARPSGRMAMETYTKLRQQGASDDYGAP